MFCRFPEHSGRAIHKLGKMADGRKPCQVVMRWENKEGSRLIFSMESIECVPQTCQLPDPDIGTRDSTLLHSPPFKTHSTYLLSLKHAAV